MNDTMSINLFLVTIGMLLGVIFLAAGVVIGAASERISKDKLDMADSGIVLPDVGLADIGNNVPNDKWDIPIGENTDKDMGYNPYQE